MTKKPLYLRLDSEKHHQLTVIADDVNLSLNQLFERVTDLIIQGNINITNNGIYLHNDSSDSILIKSDSIYQDINNQIASIKDELLNQQINIDNQINLLTQRIDKLENDNDSLKQNNIVLNNKLELMKENQDKLSSELVNSENNDDVETLKQSESTWTHLPESDSVKIPESDDIILDSENSPNQNYALMTIHQLKNKLDLLGISYLKKANKSELLKLLSNCG